MEGREVVVQGKTVKDARLAARKLLQVSDDRLRVEVLDEGSKGLFGLLGRPATIRVVLRPKIKRVRQIWDSEPDQEGTAEVSGGRIRVYGPQGAGQAAVIIPTPGIVLRVNGIAVHSPRQVRENDDIGLELPEEVHPAVLEVEVSSDGFTARAKITPQITVRYDLVDQNAQNVIQLVTRRHEEKIKVITAPEVEEALRSKGVTFGIDHEEISRLVAAADGATRVVARGEPVREGRDGFVEYLFKLDPEEITYRDEDRVNYWERFDFPSVKEGDVLAVLHHPVPGMPGKMVTGEDVLPLAVREASLRAKDGVVISDGGRKAVAAVAGRPVLEGYRQPYLKIVQLMVHSGDVDIRSGNLHYWGDLLILGNVTEGTQVAAYGDINIMGNVTGAVIQAGGRVVCQGKIIGSRVRAGGLKAFYNRLAPLLDDLDRILNEITRETARIQRHPVYHDRLKKDDIDKIVTILVERIRQKIKVLADRYAAALEGVDLPFPPVISELAQGIRRFFSGPAGLEAPIHENLESIVRKKEDISHLLDSLLDQPGDILCAYIQNSVLDASGNIIAGEDCYQSTLTAGKGVRVGGVFRGGEIFALGNIIIAESGSPGVSTGVAHIRVAEGASISLRKAYPGTAIQVGNRSYDLVEQKNNARIYLDSKGNLKIKISGD